MAKSIRDLSLQDLEKYLNRTINLHKREQIELREAPSHKDAQIHLARMKGLEQVFTEARLLTEEKGYITWH